MRNYKISIISLVFLVVSPLAYAAINESDLMEVSSKTEGKCIEYYTKNGVLYCSAKALDPSPVQRDIVNNEKQTIIFDQRPWKFAWGKKTDSMVTIEYVPLGENINDWKELVTSQYMTQVPPNISPRSLAELIVNDLKKKGFDPVITFHKVTPDLVILNFALRNLITFMVQDEIQGNPERR